MFWKDEENCMLKKLVSKSKILGLLFVLVITLFFPVNGKAYELWGYWLDGNNKILRYNQPGTKHSLQVAHADIHWNNQAKGTIQRMDNDYNVKLLDYYQANTTGGITDSVTRTIKFNDFLDDKR